MAGNSAIKGITVSIGGDTTQLSSALKKVNDDSRATQNELKAVNKALKFDPSNTTLLTQKQELLTKQISTTKDKLEILKRAQSEFSEEAKGTEEGAAQYRALEREIALTESSIRSMETAQNEVNDALNGGGAQTAANDMSSLSNETNEASGSMKDFGQVVSEKLKAAGEAITNFGTSWSKNVTAPLAAIGTASVKAFNDVDAGVDAIIVATGASGDALEGMSQVMQNLATSIPTDFETAGNAVGAVNTKFGLTGTELESLSGQFIKFATLNRVDVVNAVTDTQQALGAFRLNAKSASGVLDTMTAASQRYGVSADTLMKGLVTSAPAFKELGLNILQAINFMGQLEVSGADSAAVLSGLSKASKKAAKDGIPFSKALEDLQEKILNGETATDGLSTAYELFGTTGAQVFQGIRNGTIDLASLGSHFEMLQGTQQTVSDTFEATLSAPQQWTMALNELKLVGAEVGATLLDVLLPIIEKARDVFRNIKEAWDGLSPETQEMIVKIALIAAAIGPVLVVVGKLVSALSGIGTVISLIMAHPILALIGAIVAALVTLYATNEDFRNAVNEGLASIWAAIQSFMQVAWPYIEQFFSLVMTGLATVIEFIMPYVVQFITDVMAGLEVIITGITTAVSWLSERFTEISGFLSDGVAKFLEFKDNVIAHVMAIIDGIRELPSKIKEKFDEAVTSAKEAFTNGNLPQFLWDCLIGALDFISGIKDRFFSYGSELISGFADGISSGIEWVKNAASSVADTVSSWLHFSRPDVGPLREYDKWMPDLMSGLAQGIEKNKDKVTEALGSLTSDMTTSFDVTANASGLFDAGVGYAQNSTTIGNITIEVNTRDGQSAADIADEIENRMAARIRTGAMAWQ